jgi:hypothetical protein
VASECKSTIDQIQSMRQILEKHWNMESTFKLFIDFKAAYDTIKREKLFGTAEDGIFVASVTKFFQQFAIFY